MRNYYSKFSIVVTFQSTRQNLVVCRIVGFDLIVSPILKFKKPQPYGKIKILENMLAFINAMRARYAAMPHGQQA